MSKAEELAKAAWADYEYREHPQGLYHTCFCDGFTQGYEQSEKDTIERAISWLIEHVDDYIVDMEVSRNRPSKLHVGGACWSDLKAFMEEEDD